MNNTAKKQGINFATIINSSLLIAALTGFIYSLGFLFYINYYKHFNIPPELIPSIDLKRVLARGSFVLFNKLPILTGVSVSIILVFVFFENQFRKNPFFDRFFIFLNRFRYLFVTLVLICLLLYSFPEAREYGLGKARYDAWHLPRVHVKLNPATKDFVLPTKLCLLTIIEHNFVLFKPEKNAAIRPQVFLVPKSELSFLVFQEFKK